MSGMLCSGAAVFGVMAAAAVFTFLFRAVTRLAPQRFVFCCCSFLLLVQVLDVCLLRRTKVERAADVKLPPLTVCIRRDALSPQERDFYEALFKQTATQFVRLLTHDCR